MERELVASFPLLLTEELCTTLSNLRYDDMDPVIVYEQMDYLNARTSLPRDTPLLIVKLVATIYFHDRVGQAAALKHIQALEKKRAA